MWTEIKLNPYAHHTLKRNKDLNINGETVTLIEGCGGQDVCDLGIKKNFLNEKKIAQTTDEK